MRRVRTDVLTAERPLLRGWLHALALVAALPAGVLMVVFAAGAQARTGAAIYVGTLILAFAVSASYHRLAQSYRARRIMQRLDHCSIYLLITGTYAPVCLVALPLAYGIPLLATVGVLGFVGMATKLSSRFQWLGYALYPIMGWAAVAVAPALGEHLSAVELGLIVAGGVAYTVGFPVLLLRWPDPWPRSFGYHEVWHGFTVLAAVLHFGAVALIVA